MQYNELSVVLGTCQYEVSALSSALGNYINIGAECTQIRFITSHRNTLLAVL